MADQEEQIDVVLDEPALAPDDVEIVHVEDEKPKREQKKKGIELKPGACWAQIEGTEHDH